MTPAGWIIMLLSVGFVTFLFAWCIWRVLSHPDATEHMHSELNIDTHDTDD